MNQADSEVVLGVLEPAGFARAARAEDAQLVMLNTCAIREGARPRRLSPQADVDGSLHNLARVS